MKTTTSNITAIDTARTASTNPSTKLLETNSASLNITIDALRGAWHQTEAAIQSSREGLYNFLGLTYQYAVEIGSDDDRVTALRRTVRALYESDTQKKKIGEKSAAELLLAASMGIEQAALRSKYKKLLVSAAKDKVPADVESFKNWLTQSGGVVSALKATVGGLSTKKISSAQRSVESLMSDLISTCDESPTEDRTFSATYNNFAVVLYYTHPITKATHRIAVLADPAAVEAAIRNALKTAHVMIPIVDKAA